MVLNENSRLKLDIKATNGTFRCYCLRSSLCSIIITWFYNQ